ncbi:uncharacterized protein LOC103108625 [Erinaceus europaeus]|uniref:Uncharacterized protein LOC103108625 n=1 Tax=Erinaceus europaeus TaxID=9365 RepID=A0ABM3VSR9_ERIEU|nr:uncharacterized protein LOC103108625 [Erinaceus europaeus]
MFTVVVEVEQGRGLGPDACHPNLLLEGSQSMRLLPPGTLETQEQSFTFDRVLGAEAAQEAEKEMLTQVQSILGFVGQGYSVALLLQGREKEAPWLVPQLLQMLFEEALPQTGSDPVLSTLSLVQLSPSGRTQDLLFPGAENLLVLDVAPLGLVVKGVHEVEVPDSKAASELYLQATVGEGRDCSLLTLTMSCPGPDSPQGPGPQSMWRGVLRILQLPGALDCPLLQVLAGEATGEEVEGSLPWIISWLLEGNNYSGLLLRLDAPGSSLSLLQAALLGAMRLRMQVKQVRPTLWDAVEEARARRLDLNSLRSCLLGDTLTDGDLSQLGRALRELQVVKGWSRCFESWMLRGVKAEAVGLLQPQQVTDSAVSHNPGLQGEHQGRNASLGPGCHQKHPLGYSKEEAPDVVLQFFLAQIRRQRLREQHQLLIQEEIKHLEQEEEEVDNQVKDLVAGKEASKERQRWYWEQTVRKLQLEALQEECDAAEQDLVVLYDLHVLAARTRHVLQVFQAWRALWEEQAMTREHHYRGLLAGVLQDTFKLVTQNQEFQAQKQKFQQSTD